MCPGFHQAWRVVLSQRMQDQEGSERGGELCSGDVKFSEPVPCQIYGPGVQEGDLEAHISE